MKPSIARAWAWALAALVVPGVVATAAALRPDGGERQGPPALADVPAARVQRLVVEADGRQVALSRTADGWSADPGTPPGSAPLLAGSERQLFPMLGYRVLEADATDPQYGLADPAAVLQLQDRDGRQIGIRLGAASFSGAGFYARDDGDAGRVYLVPRNTVDLLRSLTTGERTSSADPLQDRAGRYEAERDETGREKEVPVYLRQVLERGGRMPPPEP
ncbi:MAG: DUF4340 domain-containing protein [Actinomycetota bacterium]|jgi:hypothetical protein